jgi:hypothetical protein
MRQRARCFVRHMRRALCSLMQLTCLPAVSTFSCLSCSTADLFLHVGCDCSAAFYQGSMLCVFSCGYSCGQQQTFDFDNSLTMLYGSGNEPSCCWHAAGYFACALRTRLTAAR